MWRTIAFSLLWVGLVAYAFALAPPNSPETPALLRQLASGQWQDLNPLLVALFNLMGIWPIAYASVLASDGSGQPVRAWPFALTAFAVGAFALLPYLALRRANPTLAGGKSGPLKLLDRRATGILLLIASVPLLGYGLLWGDWHAFAQQWQSNRFVHVMSLDFCLLCALFPSLLGDDMARRGLHEPAVFWAVSLIPLLGPLAYLSARPPLPEGSGVAHQASPH
ncbi:MAG: DUF2834 domain-containing protein [Cyanobacteria bacterium QS_8_64_29]|nr:MAG: DUF2834 domain-containing protein [Cyanobacteria bacterium QS_8_64_29]